MSDLGDIVVELEKLVEGITLKNGDIQIGAVEIKDGDSDTKAAVNDEGQLHVVLMGKVDDDNSSSTPLDADAVFTGTAFNTLDFGYIFVTIFADQDSATDGLSFQQSPDGTNWNNSDLYSISANVGKTYSIQPAAKWFRVVYTNGDTNQSAFRLQTILKKTSSLSSSHRISDNLSPEDDAILGISVIKGQKPNGDYTNYNATAGGNFKMSIEEVESGVSFDTKSPAIVNAGNSSTTPLNSGVTFTGSSVDMLNFSTVRVSLFSDEDSATDGFQVQFSNDNSNWDFPRKTTYVSNGGGYACYNRVARYMRIVYTNGNTNQGVFRLQTLLVPNSMEFSRSFMNEDTKDHDNAIHVKSVILAKDPGGTWGAIDRTNGGNLKTSTQEISDGLDIGAGNAGSETARVSISSDDVNLSGLLAELKVMNGAYAQRTDDVGGGVTYRGWAVPGTATSVSSWRITRITETSGDFVMDFADGDNNFDNEWDERAALSYS